MNVILFALAVDEARAVRAEFRRLSPDSNLARADDLDGLERLLTVGSWDLLVTSPCRKVSLRRLQRALSDAGRRLPLFVALDPEEDGVYFARLASGSGPTVSPGEGEREGVGEVDGEGEGEREVEGEGEAEHGLLEAPAEGGADEVRHTLAFVAPLLEALPNPLYWKGSDGVFLWCNKAFAEDVMGVSREEVIGRRLADFGAWIPALNIESHAELDRQLLRDGRVQVVNVDLPRGDGRIRSFQLSKAALLDPAGRPTGIIGVFSDTTDLKVAQSALREQTEVLSRVLETIPHFVFWKDTSSVFLGCNENFARAAGLQSPDQIVGKTDFDLSWGREQAEIYRSGDQEVMSSGRPLLNVEESQLRPDGAEAVIVTSKVPLRDYRGVIVGVLGTFIDVTAQKQAEHEIVRLATAVEHAAESIVITGTEGRILYANPAFERITGYSRAEALGKTPSILKSGVHPPEFYRQIYEAIWRGDTWRGRFKNRRKDGTHYDAECSISPIRDGAGRIVNFVAVSRDVTAALLQEAELIQARKLESIGQLAAGIAHEINTPTQFVGDNVRFLLDAFQEVLPILQTLIKGDGAGSSESAEAGLDLHRGAPAAMAESVAYYADEIPRAIHQTLEGIERITKIVRAMKEFSHPGHAEQTAIDINHAIESTLTVARNYWKYIADARTDFDPELPPVLCYPGELNQVILNLIMNAADAITETNKALARERGSITITTRKEGDEVVIRITDDGCGIPESIADRVFDHFFTTKEVGRGTGQGLAIAHSVIVQKHGGKIDFESEVGRGTTFVVRLPLGGRLHEEALHIAQPH
jgi:PAS domain S-box-containing protein